MDKNKKLKKLRDKIDRADFKIADALAKRFRITNEIIIFKKENNIPIEDKNREMEIMSKLEKLSQKLEIKSELLRNIWELIIKDVKR